MTRASSVPVREGRLAIKRVAAALAIGLCGATSTASPAVEGPARDAPNGVYWFTLFAGPRGAAPGTMSAAVKVGPFATLAICYGAGALAIDALNRENPEREFAGGCVPGERLTLAEIADRTLPQHQPEEKNR